MQLLLNADELNLLADTLLEEIRYATQEKLDPRRYNEVLDKVLTRDLRFDFDELGTMADLLVTEKRRIKSTIGCKLEGQLKLRLDRLEGTLLKIEEALATV